METGGSEHLFSIWLITPYLVSKFILTLLIYFINVYLFYTTLSPMSSISGLPCQLEQIYSEPTFNPLLPVASTIAPILVA